MNIQENVSLKTFNTFGIDAKANRYVNIQSVENLQEILKTEASKSIFILGGGSNMLLTKDIESLVIHLNLKGIAITEETDDYAIVKAQAGENWHEFVLWCIDQGYGGLENLSLIPGNVGTCPIQNIGAYGNEVKDTITKVEALEIASGKHVSFSNEECKFRYRDSIFKNEEKGKYILTSVSFRLTKNSHHINTSYGAIESYLAAQDIKDPSIKDVSDAVISIRKSKLPDPNEIGNSGSFFKNPVISVAQFDELKQKYPDIPSYPISDQEVKVPAGWLIEQAGFKGKRFGDAGVHTKQALVLVNYGNATGKEVYALAQKIQSSIESVFGIHLEIEVNVIQ